MSDYYRHTVTWTLSFAQSPTVGKLMELLEDMDETAYISVPDSGGQFTLQAVFRADVHTTHHSPGADRASTGPGFQRPGE